MHNQTDRKCSNYSEIGKSLTPLTFLADPIYMLYRHTIRHSDDTISGRLRIAVIPFYIPSQYKTYFYKHIFDK